MFALYRTKSLRFPHTKNMFESKTLLPCFVKVCLHTPLPMLQFHKKLEFESGLVVNILFSHCAFCVSSFMYLCRGMPPPSCLKCCVAFA